MVAINCKIACIIGGVSGKGFEMAKFLMKHGIKGILLADKNERLAQDAICALGEHGDGSIKFLKIDAFSRNQVECALMSTVKTFKHIDIVINNATVVLEDDYERMIRVNYVAALFATMLALYKYIPEHKTGKEGYVVNSSSVFGLQPISSLPVFCAVKNAVIGIGRAFGSDYYYNRTKVKVLTMCTGITSTPSYKPGNLMGVDLKRFMEETAHYPIQDPTHCGKCLIKMINEAKNGSVWVCENGEYYQYPLRDRFAVKQEMI